MRYFIFITPEGYTYQPDSDAIEPDAENCQVLGFGKGHNISQAFENFIQENLWLLDTSYNQVMAYELKYEDCAGKFDLQFWQGVQKAADDETYEDFLALTENMRKQK